MTYYSYRDHESRSSSRRSYRRDMDSYLRRSSMLDDHDRYSYLDSSFEHDYSYGSSRVLQAHPVPRARVVEAPPHPDARPACWCFSAASPPGTCGRCYCGRGSPRSRRSSTCWDGLGNHASTLTTSTSIRVVDEEGGTTFRITLRTGATARDLLGYLAPDAGRQTVLVRWRSGEAARLEEGMAMDDVRAARRLEVRTRRVRFA